MLAEYSAGILIKGYRAYLRGDYVDTRRFAEFMERGKRNKVEVCDETVAQDKAPRIGRLRRMESRYEWALTIRENVSHFLLNVTGLKGNCRLRKTAARPTPRGSRQRGNHHAGQERLTA
jgi:hypothetical protein